jgi:hypothetical protein
MTAWRKCSRSQRAARPVTAGRSCWRRAASRRPGRAATGRLTRACGGRARTRHHLQVAQQVRDLQVVRRTPRSWVVLAGVAVMHRDPCERVEDHERVGPRQAPAVQAERGVCHCSRSARARGYRGPTRKAPGCLPRLRPAALPARRAARSTLGDRSARSAGDGGRPPTTDTAAASRARSAALPYRTAAPTAGLSSGISARTSRSRPRRLRAKVLRRSGSLGVEDCQDPQDAAGSHPTGLGSRPRGPAAPASGAGTPAGTPPPAAPGRPTPSPRGHALARRDGKRRRRSCRGPRRPARSRAAASLP